MRRWERRPEQVDRQEALTEATQTPALSPTEGIPSEGPATAKKPR